MKMNINTGKKKPGQFEYLIQLCNKKYITSLTKWYSKDGLDLKNRQKTF
jgi:hypothetical protein